MGQAATKSPQAFKSTEFVAESDNENDEPVGSESDEESESDVDSLPANPVNSKSNTNGKAAENSSSSEAESGSESESGSGSEDEEDEDEDAEEQVQPAANGKAEKAPPPSNALNGSSSKSVSTPKPVSFNPPAGFTAASFDDSRKSSQLFGDSNLEGKQIWYITAPASVSIDTIKDMSLRGARSGKVVLSQKGNEYGFVEDTAENKTYTKLMLPNKAKNGYRIVPKLANGDDSSQATVPAKKPVRKQPKGLRMRYAPVGFGLNGGGIIGDSSDEEDQSGSDLEGRGKSPKFQKPSGAEDGASDSDVVMGDAQPTPTPAKKSKSKKSAENSAENGDRPLKRKHKDEGEKKKKHKRLSPKPETTFSELTTYQRKQTKLRHSMTKVVLFPLNRPKLHPVWDTSSQNYPP
ncbi:hypothetical protein CJF31_00008396 [Rutstroemia sp. NJR-2017a BVV2]|nr:hypothetical protein CJF31_00008396 [Rutstroemia sp. NJR-2017a BVV2]